MPSQSPFPRIAEIIADGVPTGPVTIAGWVRSRRDSKRFSFIEISDGTCSATLQVLANNTLTNYGDTILSLTTGCAVRIIGELILSPGKGQKYEVHATRVELLGGADPDHYPLQKKEMTFEYLREVGHLRPRTSTFGAMLRLRSELSFAVHDFFRQKGFFYIHSPILTTSDGEGAGEAFQVTTLNLNQPPKGPSGAVDFSQDFFGEPSLLCVTGQLEAELCAMALSQVYTFGPTFRAENSNTSRHLAEFWMIEPEMAFWDLEQNMVLSEEMIRHLAHHALTRCGSDLEIIKGRTGQDTQPLLQMALEQPFVRCTYTDAVQILQSCGKAFEHTVVWGGDLKSEHERFLCEEHFKAPTIVYNYPEELKAFYMYLNDDGKTVGAMDVLIPGIGEVIGGSQREHRLDILEQRLLKKGINPEKMSWYLDTRRFGSCPHSGFGMGFERLLLWISGFTNVRDVIPFPRTPGNCPF